ncbi:MAG: class II aldolase/adducin family protein [Acidobacteria bacterium]|nr:MAG: class II aldolase/adducin family protein [Acidobacteriota bacterium]REK02319.1 MAG: class II aldolase/adducin family protein [Acidobacteriota bacterium]REK13878.1 MAG: class II aldolase/adducin family protein [Acidobacteriota bacterium]REK41872.1 MAG: class II aldolase/adducin family protein [Acidobacteriota bacterium]
MPSDINETEARELIVEVGRLMYERGYVVASDGNVSIRVGEDRIIATPTMTSKGRMTVDSLAVTDLDGNALSDKRASSELAMHILIYKNRPDVLAVCHAHPPYGTAFAVAGLPIDKPILSEVVLTLGCVPLTDYGTPSTDELTDAMKPFVAHHNALLMANHGAVAYGKDLWQAFDRMETLEHTAKIAILSRALGGANDLPPDSIEKLIHIRERAGYLDESARCQACGYLHETSVTCDLDGASVPNGAKISFTRDELIELLNSVVSRQ